MTGTLSGSSGAPPLGATSNVSTGRRVNGAGGYVYQQMPDGTIFIVSGPSGSGTLLKPNSGQAWSAITNEIGPYPTAEDAAARQATSGQAGQLFSQLAAFLSKPTSEGGPTYVEAAASVIQQVGPQAATAVQSMLANRGQSLAKLMSQLGKKQAEYATTSKLDKKIKLAFEIKGLQQQIAAQQALQAQYVSGGDIASNATPTPPPTTGAGLSAYLPYIGVGVVLLIGGAFAISYFGGRRAAPAAAAPLANPRRRRNPRKRRSRRSPRGKARRNSRPPAPQLSLKEWEELGEDYYWEPDEAPPPSASVLGGKALEAYRRGQARAEAKLGLR